jgi:hypothetical protein
VNAVPGKQQRPGDGDQEQGASQALSTFERALREALTAMPRDQVVKAIAAALPAGILVEQSARRHGGKARKVSVSMPEELTEAVRARTGAGGFSRYVTDAVQEQVRLDLLDELSAELAAEYGPIPAEIREQTRREWPDFQGE